MAVGYALIKITGGDKPALLTADSSTTEIDEDYIISQSITLALLASSGGHRLILMQGGSLVPSGLIRHREQEEHSQC